MKGFTWLTVGSFRDEAKDYDNLLQAFARLDAPGDLLIAGVGPLRAEKEALARRLGVHGRVKFLGLRSDVPRMMQAADAFVLASAWEGLPVVLLEAAASGAPAVVTRVGGNPDVVLDRTTGLVVPPKDPSALASAMREVVALSEAERRAMGRRARAHVEQTFDLERVVEGWERLYVELLEGLRERATLATRRAG
jgi:glycosyltransferase involved in cell wall biosynthesis